MAIVEGHLNTLGDMDAELVDEIDTILKDAKDTLSALTEGGAGVSADPVTARTMIAKFMREARPRLNRANHFLSEMNRVTNDLLDAF